MKKINNQQGHWLLICQCHPLVPSISSDSCAARSYCRNDPSMELRFGEVGTESPAVGGSNHFDVFSARSFWTATFVEGDSLSFLQFFESDTIQVREMEEQIASLSGVNKSESLVRQFFDCAFSHLLSISC